MDQSLKAFCNHSRKSFGISTIKLINYISYYVGMASQIKKDDISSLRKDIELIKNILREDHELSDEAREALKKARRTPKEDYVEL